MTLTFEIGSALIVCALFIALALFRRHPLGAAITGSSIILLLVAWANVSAGWHPATGVQGLIRSAFNVIRFDSVLIVKTLSTLALLAVSWWIAGIWCGGNPSPVNRPLRGRFMRTSMPGQRGSPQSPPQPVRQYRNS